MTSDVSALPPGPKGIPVFGSALPFANNSLDFLSNLLKFGDIASFKVMGANYVVVHSPELIQQVLISHAKKYEKNIFLKKIWRPLLGDGLLSSDGETWKKARKLSNPSFTREQIAAYTTAVEACARERIASWNVGEVKNIDTELVDLTLRVVISTLFGSDLNAATLNKLRDGFQVCTDYFNYSIGPTAMLTAKIPTPQKSLFSRTVKDLRGMVRNLIEVRRRNIEGKVDLLSSLIRSREEEWNDTTENELVDEVLTLIGGGHETTALALTFTFHLLAENPEWMEKVQREIDVVLGNKSMSEVSVKDFVVMGKVFHESLRLYAPAPVIARNVVEEDQIGGFNIPKNTLVLVPIWAVQRNPQFYKDPTVFQPQRWDGDLAQTLPKTAYMPFGYGPRICIGSGFAMMEAMTIMAVILQKFSFEKPKRPLRFKLGISARPRDPVRLELKSR
ncbi:MAG: cytochrome P450 [Bdellovibrionota bacterium]